MKDSFETLYTSYIYTQHLSEKGIITLGRDFLI